MRYGELKPRDLEILFYGLSQANKLLYEKTNSPEVAKLWDDLSHFSHMTVTLSTYNLKKIEKKEIDENEMTRLIVKVLVAAFSIMNSEVREKIIPDGGEDELLASINKALLDLDGFLLKVSAHFPEFFEEITKMSVERSRTFIRIWLENINAIDTTHGHDKTVNYQGLEEFLLDLIEANLQTSKGKTKHLWQVTKDVLPQTMKIIKGGYREHQVGEREHPDRFASNLLSALVTGVNLNLEREKEKTDEFIMKHSNNFDGFEFFHKVLSPGLVWWVKKELGESISEDKIIKTENF